MLVKIAHIHTHAQAHLDTPKRGLRVDFKIYHDRDIAQQQQQQQQQQNDLSSTRIVNFSRSPLFLASETSAICGD